MSTEKIPLHYVCTPSEARDLVQTHEHFWVSNCGCRESRGNKCIVSRIDLCLLFRGDIKASGSGMRRITIDEVNEILHEAKDKQLVARPFRNEHDRSITDGICFCCYECCEYFTKPDEICDKGRYIEETDRDRCSHCGTCTEICYFNAREIISDELSIDRARCYGCGLCVELCPEDCIRMVHAQ